MLISFLSFGQEKTITGIVSDKNEPIPFVTIIVKGTKIGVQTDFDGEFSIKAKKGDKLLISALGYDNYELEIGEKISEYNIQLKSNAVLLEEHYGCYPKHKKKLLPSTTLVSETDIKKPIEENKQSLEGKIPGVTIQNNEKPFVFKLCNHQVDESNVPLYIIDGIISTKEKISEINPNNIESVDVLKENSATALYGIQGKNGALVIKTKKASRKEIKKMKKLSK